MNKEFFLWSTTTNLNLHIKRLANYKTDNNQTFCRIVCIAYERHVHLPRQRRDKAQETVGATAATATAPPTRVASHTEKFPKPKLKAKVSSANFARKLLLQEKNSKEGKKFALLLLQKSIDPV